MILNRPSKRNALSLELIEEMHLGLDKIENDNSIRALILSGEGNSFCSGMDLKGVIDDPKKMQIMLRRLSGVTKRIRSLPIPTIASVQGAAIGGGCGLMIVCDFAFTHPEAKVGFPEVDLGVCPAVVAPWLIKKIGSGKARAMLLAGGTMTGEQGFHSGLVSHLTNQNELFHAVESFAKKLAKGGKDAMATTKFWLNKLDGSLDDEILKKAADLSAEIIAGEEAQSRLKPLYS
mgnify:CR=1 FL=1